MSSLSSIRSRVGALTGALVVLAPLSQLGFVPVSAVLGDQLGINPATVGVAIGLYAISSGVATVLFGPLFDLVPARRILPWAVLANFVVSVAFIWVPNVGMLIAGRILAGFANSAMAMTASVIVADAFRERPQERDRAFSGLQTFISTGAITGLALGGLCAGLGWPWLYFASVAVYAFFILCLTPFMQRRMKRLDKERESVLAAERADDSPSDPPRSALRVLLREIGVLLTRPRTVLLLCSAACASWVLQAGHYTLSMLLNAEHPDMIVRTLLTILIPAGVLLGALANQWSLGRLRPRSVYGRAFILLPVVTGALAASMFTDIIVLWGMAFVAVGIVCGMLGPLQPTMMISWYPDVRGSAAAAVQVSASLGAALGPVVLGAVAAVWILPGAVLVSASVALVGAVLAAFLLRTKDPSATPAPRPDTGASVAAVE